MNLNWRRKSLNFFLSEFLIKISSNCVHQNDERCERCEWSMQRFDVWYGRPNCFYRAIYTLYCHILYIKIFWWMALNWFSVNLFFIKDYEPYIRLFIIRFWIPNSLSFPVSIPLYIRSVLNSTEQCRTVANSGDHCQWAQVSTNQNQRKKIKKAFVGQYVRSNTIVFNIRALNNTETELISSCAQHYNTKS